MFLDDLVGVVVHVSMSVVSWAPQSWWEAQSDQALAAIQASPFYSDDDKALASKEWSRRVKAKLAERSCAP